MTVFDFTRVLLGSLYVYEVQRHINLSFSLMDKLAKNLRHVSFEALLLALLNPKPACPLFLQGLEGTPGDPLVLPLC